MYKTRILPALLIGALFSAGCSSLKSTPYSFPQPQLGVNPVQQLYVKHCSECHGRDRWGSSGPALIPETLGKLGKVKAESVIREGRTATQMAGFAQKLRPEEIQTLVEFVFQPLPEPPKWNSEDILASRKIFFEGPFAAKPVFKADPLNLFFVVTHGDHKLTLLDGDSFESLQQIETRPGLHGGIKYTADGRSAFAVSRDGWLTKIDIYSLRVVGEVRVGINTRNIAISGDGRYVAAANLLPGSVVILKTSDLTPVKVIPALSIEGKSSGVAAIYTAPPRASFIVALKDVSEAWEIPYGDEVSAPYTGLVHDFRADSGETIVEKPERFPIRRLEIHGILEDFFFDSKYQHLLGTSRAGEKAQVVNLIVGRTIVELEIPGMPHLGSGIGWDYRGGRVMATPNLKEGVISVIDTKNWKVLKKIKTPGPGFFIRSHEKSSYAWTDSFLSPRTKDQIHIIDKRTLRLVRSLTPIPGKTAAHVEFTRDGRYALLSIWEDEGYLIVYDSKTLREVRRIPMKRPSGKYNVFNKINFSEGTSH